jgi:RNA polymerase sigma-70 factor, ECF subfamily
MAQPELFGLNDFDAVVHCHRKQIFRFVLYSVHDREIAETLTQECFLKAYLARHGFRGDATVATWLNRIALNLIRDHFRSPCKTFWRKISANSLELTAIRDCIPDGRSSSEQVLVARSQLNTLWKAVRRLPPSQRTIFVMRFVDELQLSEIAKLIGLKQNTVRAHLHRALKTVRSSLSRPSLK